LQNRRFPSQARHRHKPEPFTFFERRSSLKKILIVSILLFAFSSPVFAQTKSFTFKSVGTAPVDDKAFVNATCFWAKFRAEMAGNKKLKSYVNTNFESDGKTVRASCTVFPKK
jgi:hypothetical protein